MVVCMVLSWFSSEFQRMYLSYDVDYTIESAQASERNLNLLRSLKEVIQTTRRTCNVSLHETACIVLMLTHLYSLWLYQIIRFNEICNVHITDMTNPQSLAILWTIGPQNFQPIFIHVLESENCNESANYSKKCLRANQSVNLYGLHRGEAKGSK